MDFLALTLKLCFRKIYFLLGFFKVIIFISPLTSRVRMIRLNTLQKNVNDYEQAFLLKYRKGFKEMEIKSCSNQIYNKPLWQMWDRLIDK